MDSRIKNQPKQHLNPSQYDLVDQLVDAGLNDKEIAAHLNAYASSVREYRRNRKAKRRESKVQERVDSPVPETAVESDDSTPPLWNDGVTIEDISGSPDAHSVLVKAQLREESHETPAEGATSVPVNRNDQKAFLLTVHGMTAAEIAAELCVSGTSAEELRANALKKIRKCSDDEVLFGQLLEYLAQDGATVHEASESLGMNMDVVAEVARRQNVQFEEVSSTPTSVRRRKVWSLRQSKRVSEVAAELDLTERQVKASYSVHPWASYGAEAMELVMHGMDEVDIEWALGVTDEQSAMLALRARLEIDSRVNDDHWVSVQLLRMSSWGVSSKHAAEGLGITLERLCGVAAETPQIPVAWYLSKTDFVIKDAIIDLMMKEMSAEDIAAKMKLSGGEEVHRRFALARLDFGNIEYQISRQKEGLRIQQIKDMTSRGATAEGIARAMGLDVSTVVNIAKRNRLRLL